MLDEDNFNMLYIIFIVISVITITMVNRYKVKDKVVKDKVVKDKVKDPNDVNLNQLTMHIVMCFRKIGIIVYKDQFDIEFVRQTITKSTIILVTWSIPNKPDLKFHIRVNAWVNPSDVYVITIDYTYEHAMYYMITKHITTLYC